MRPRKGTRVAPVALVSLDQAAEHHRAAVLDQHVGVDRALVGDGRCGMLVCPMLELSCSIFSVTASPPLICGVILRIVPTSWRWMVWNGFTCPLLLFRVFVYCPVMNGTSCATLISASWLSVA
jgi:hypothetical protein